MASGGGDEHIPFSIPAEDTSIDNGDLMDGFVEQTNQVISIMYEERYIEDHPEHSDRHHLPEPVLAVAENVDKCDAEVKKIGRRLAAVGDEIEKQYGSKIDELVKQFFTSNQGTPFQRFKQIAESLLSPDWNIGRVMALLMFGYKIAVSKLTDCTSSFFMDVIKMVVKFLFLKNILGWVKGQGGWEGVAENAPSGSPLMSFVSLNTLQTTVLICGVVVVAGILIIKLR